MKLSPQDQIWNRACLESGGTSPRTGDQALAALLLSHGLVMNGDVVHALECLSDSEIAAAIRGFEYFGLMEGAIRSGQRVVSEVLTAHDSRSLVSELT